jgi:hypothetical protein
MGMNYAEFVYRMNEIKKMGYVLTHRQGPTGIGKTLEDLLGITENNIAGPDFSNYELKSGRKDSVSMLTLFTKAPQPKGANRELLRVFGYLQRKRPIGHEQRTLTGELLNESHVPIEHKELHVTVDSVKPNSVGLQLEVEEGKIIISNDKGVEAYYDENTLRESFQKKYHQLVYVLAESKKEKRKEYFWYSETYLLKGFSFSNFSGLIREGKIKVDIRIGHYPDGRLHDHGTGFRILPKYLPECFEEIEKVI